MGYTRRKRGIRKSGKGTEYSLCSDSRKRSQWCFIKGTLLINRLVVDARGVLKRSPWVLFIYASFSLMSFFLSIHQARHWATGITSPTSVNQSLHNDHHSCVNGIPQSDTQHDSLRRWIAGLRQPAYSSKNSSPTQWKTGKPPPLRRIWSISKGVGFWQSYYKYRWISSLPEIFSSSL